MIKIIGSSNNVNGIISQAIKLNKLDIVQQLITQCHLDSRIVMTKRYKRNI